MQLQRSVIDSPIRWGSFVVLLIVFAIWTLRDVVPRANRMKPADQQASTYFATTAGSKTTAVVILDGVAGKVLKGRLLRRDTDTTYHTPPKGEFPVTAVLTPETAVVMGKPADVIPGAIVQLSGILDSHHAMHTSEIVILTGYVHLSAGGR